MIKQQAFHGDDSAQPVIYSAIIQHGPYIKIVSGGKSIQIGRTQLAGSLELIQEIPSDILEEEDCAGLRNSLAATKAFSIKYPKSLPVLKPHIESLENHVSKFDAGQVRYEGIWMSGLDYAKIKAKQKANDSAAKRQKEEDNAFAKKQKDKGLFFHDGEWVTKDKIIINDTTGQFDLASEIAPIRKPDFESARMAVNNLNVALEKQTGVERLKTERLLSVIKNLFAADLRYTQQLEAFRMDELEALKNDQNAENWRLPNAFGKTNEVMAKQAELKAAEIREKSLQQLEEKRDGLIAQLQETDAVVHEFHKLQEFGVVLTLLEASKAINKRNLKEGSFVSSFPDAALTEIRELLKNRNEWILTARNAEAAENYEEAIRFYSKALDIGSKKRCAMQLAINLEKGNLPGSAIEYYEIAGDYKKAAALREQNPDLRMESFRKLDAEDLFAKIAPSCVRIVDGNGGMGSGFFFKQGGFILTNNHVVENPSSITVKLDDEREFKAKIICKGDQLDLAVLRIDLAGHDVIGIRQEDVKIGMSVALIGYPIKDLPTATMNSGRISNTDRTYKNNPVYQLDVSANHGNSGGPVVDEAGRLVGVLTFGLGDLDIDRFNFAITNDAVQGFLDQKMK